MYIITKAGWATWAIQHFQLAYLVHPMAKAVSRPFSNYTHLQATIRSVSIRLEATDEARARREEDGLINDVIRFVSISARPRGSPLSSLSSKDGKSLPAALCTLYWFVLSTHQLRRQARLRREYLYRKSMEHQEKATLDRKRKLSQAMEGSRIHLKPTC